MTLHEWFQLEMKKARFHFKTRTILADVDAVEDWDAAREAIAKGEPVAVKAGSQFEVRDSIESAKRELRFLVQIVDRLPPEVAAELLDDAQTLLGDIADGKALIDALRDRTAGPKPLGSITDLVTRARGATGVPNDEVQR